MVKLKVTLILSFIFLISFLTSFGQTTREQVEMADAFHSNGKIYIVITVLSIVFVGIVIYLVSMDRKLNRIERKLTEKK
jgi:CcmD family protein